MKRLGTFEGRAIVASEFAPENKYDIWYDATENKYKECIDGSWVESPNIATPGSGGGGGNFPYEYVCPNDFSATIQYEDWQEGDEGVCCYINIGEEIPFQKMQMVRFHVNDSTGSESESCYVTVGSDRHRQTELEIYYSTEEENQLRFLCACWSTDNLERNSPITLNFTDMIFIGEKKSE